jgi:hypothetical protein
MIDLDAALIFPAHQREQYVYFRAGVGVNR